MNVSHHVVYIILVNNNFREAALDKSVEEFFYRATFYVNSLHLCAWHHTVSYLSICKIECILEYLHLVFNILIILGIIYARLHKIIEVYLCESLVVIIIFNVYTENQQQNL